eukprot:2355220-Rhodomonas_salina.1
MFFRRRIRKGLDFRSAYPDRFTRFDSDGSGEIDYKEFSLLMDAGKEQVRQGVGVQASGLRLQGFGFRVYASVALRVEL